DVQRAHRARRRHRRDAARPGASSRRCRRIAADGAPRRQSRDGSGRVITMRRLLFTAVLAAAVSTAAAGSLTIYFIDVEGGQSTLVVTPAGESLLIDAGFPSDGKFSSTPGDPASARDAQRVVAALRDAGLKQIDDLMVTHFHADHDGGVPELAKLVTIRRFIDHGR